MEKRIINTLSESLNKKDWSAAYEGLNAKGYAVIQNVLTTEECKRLIDDYSNDSLYRKTVIMERYRFGLGEYKYFQYPLPELIDTIRNTVYPYLANVANLWMKALNIDTIYPSTHEALKTQCHAAGQTKPTVLILKYFKDGFNTLHQDLYGDIFFPIQLVIFLNEPEEDYTGGEFILTEAIPRAQSKATVLRPKRGDILLFTTNFRPVKGTKGFYRVNMKHGVSPVTNGVRHTLGIIFHDALT